MVKKIIRIVAIVLLLLNAIGAIYGGAILIYDPSGEFIQMPLELLDHSPFSNFLIPGIILLLFNGLLSLVAAFVTLKRYKFYPLLTVSQGIVLITWLTVQLIMIREFFAPLHLTFYVIGTALVAIGLYLRKPALKE